MTKTGPNQLALWPRHELTELPARGAGRRPRSGRLQAVGGRADVRICENCRKAFTQVDQPAKRSWRGLRRHAGTTSRSGSPSTPSAFATSFDAEGLAQ
jgi:hypothetical protein